MDLGAPIPAVLTGRRGSAQIRIDVAGDATATSATIVDPRGQAHLTAVGGFLGLRRVLAADAVAGVTFPELHPRLDSALRELEEQGVEVLTS